MRLIKLCFFAGLAGLLPQISWALAVQAQSIVEQRLCRYSGKYVVFAQRPLQALPIRVPLPRGDRNNIELAHEHIFFCNNGRVERNIGFGPDGMFSESALSEKYVLIDEERYDSEIMTQILPKQLLSKQCHETNPVGEYGLRTNNCQDFAERVRQLYWKRVVTGTYSFSGVNPNGSRYSGGTCIVSVNQAGLIQFSWTLGQQSWQGTAEPTGRAMNVTFSGSFSGSGIYTLQQDGSISGVWQETGNSSQGNESLVPIRSTGN